MTLELAMWAVTGASIVGTVANIYKCRWGFGVWLATNLSWVAYDVHLAAWPQAALFGVYSGLAAWGLWKWRPE